MCEWECEFVLPWVLSTFQPPIARDLIVKLWLLFNDNFNNNHPKRLLQATFQHNFWLYLIFCVMRYENLRPKRQVHVSYFPSYSMALAEGTLKWRQCLISGLGNTRLVGLSGRTAFCCHSQENKRFLREMNYNSTLSKNRAEGLKERRESEGLVGLMAFFSFFFFFCSYTVWSWKMHTSSRGRQKLRASWKLGELIKSGCLNRLNQYYSA